MPDALSRYYARFVSSLEYGQLPEQVVDKLKASVLHAMVVSIIGAQTHHGEAAIALTKEEDAKPGGATILVDGTKGAADFARRCRRFCWRRDALSGHRMDTRYFSHAVTALRDHNR